MEKTYYCKWDPPVSHPERFALWSRDVQKLVEYFPHYIASDRKQRMKVLDLDNVHEGEFFRRQDLEDYNPQRYSQRKSWLAPKEGQYALLPLGPVGTGPIHITGLDGVEEPIITETVVAFCVTDSSNDHPDPFHLSQEELVHGTTEEHRGALLWKTTWSLHDLLLIAALVRLKYYFSEIHIATYLTAEDMRDGIELCQKVFGRGKDPTRDENKIFYVLKLTIRFLAGKLANLVLRK